MTYRGKIQNGVVIFEGETPPEGSLVQVEPLEDRSCDEVIKTNTVKSIWDKLLELQGQAPDLPEDAARDHDHYLYGTPKK